MSSDIRRHNLSLLTRQLASNGPQSRTRLAETTGLTKGAITALTAALVEVGVLREGDEGASPARAGTGRKRTLLRLAADDMAILVLQLDADVATALLTTLAGDELLRTERHHGRPMGQPGPIIDVLADTLRGALDEAARIGRRVLDSVVVVFAPVSGDPAIVVADTDLDWGPIDLLGELRAREPRLAPDARLCPDAALAAQAEHSLLPGIDEMLYIKSNSGIGGAAIAGGRLVVGSRSMAGAFGHIAIVPNGEPCLCGQHGCLVTVAGPDVVLRDAGLDGLRQSAGLTVALGELVRRLRAGDEQAVAAWEPASEWLARTLSVLTLSFDPAAIVLGGYWAELTDLVEPRLRRLVPPIAVAAGWTPPAILAGTLGADAALNGAVWNARDRLLFDPMQLSARRD
ncbi:ROK family protein [Microterricola gilva]|uniref:ROK family protein n=1 Tax=Microterricola gilva TaxID=393267 RepID=UPI0013EE4F3F|nr:ROK family protein [Microterricola gilva]